MVGTKAGEVAVRDWSAEDRAWALKRDWTDMPFQDGAENNRACLQAFEDTLVSRLRQSCFRELGKEVGDQSPAANGSVGANVLARVLDPLAAHTDGPSDSVRTAVLDDPEVLGSSLDIVGAYLKNYEVDRAAAVVETVLPACRSRGGLWLLKALNHLATVRMKQARPKEALDALREVEAQANAGLHEGEHDEAWEFWETIYRNFGWVLSDLGQEQEAIAYIQRAIDVKARVGMIASWFDLWDLGRMKAGYALRRKEADSIREAQAVTTKALKLHQEEQVKDLVMRAKIWHSVGEGSFALGHLAEDSAESASNPHGPCSSSAAKAHYRKALKCFQQAHKLFKSTEGAHNPLTGSEAQAVAWALLKLDQQEEAKGFLLDSLEALSQQQSGWGRGDCLDAHAPALSQAVQTVDRILEAHRRTEDREGLEKYFQSVERLCSNIGARLKLSKDRADAAIYEKLVSSCSMIMVASGTAEGTSRSQDLMRRFMWKSPDTAQAKLCSEIMTASLQNGEGGGERGAAQPALTDGPGMRAFMDALAKMR